MDPQFFATNGTISPNQTKAAPAFLTQKNVALLPSKTVVERINLEPIYTQLKSALGDFWADYKAALNAFVLGSLNQAELSWVLQPLLSSAPSVIISTDPTKSPLSTLQLHNTLLTAIYANTLRDPPPSEVAPWVVATDKPTSTSKNAGPGSGANDKAEERLKRETVAIHARDRKRIKALKDVSKPVNNGYQSIQDYGNELAAKPSSYSQAQTEPQSATGMGPGGTAGTGLGGRTFDLDSGRRRFMHSLAAESMEFPALQDMLNRIEPICQEEGLAGVQGNIAQSCAELIEQATEVYIKEMLGTLLTHARSNAAGDGIQTSKFRRQLRKEEGDAERGTLLRNAAGLLPVEMELQVSRTPLDMQDLRLALGMADPFLRSDRYLDEMIMLNQYPDLDFGLGINGNGYSGGIPLTNGIGKVDQAIGDLSDPDAMAVDDFEYGSFKGVGRSDFDSTMSVLDDCLLAIPG